MRRRSAAQGLALTAGFLLALQLMAIWAVVGDLNYFGIRLGLGALNGRLSPGQVPVIGALYVAIGVGAAVGAAVGSPSFFAGTAGLITSSLTTWLVVAIAGAQTEDGAAGVAGIATGPFSGPALAWLAAFLFFLAAAIDSKRERLTPTPSGEFRQSVEVSPPSSDSSGTEVIADTS